MNGAIFVKRIDEVLDRKNMKRAELLRMLELPKSSITNWEQRGTIPAADIAYNIAQCLGVDLVWLLTGQESGFTNEELKLVNEFNSLTESQRVSITSLIKVYLEQNETDLKKSLSS